MTSPEGKSQVAASDDPAPALKTAEAGWALTPPRSWAAAYGRALVVLLYFAIATVWLPSFLIGSTTDEGFREIVVTTTWVLGFGGGLWGLNELRKRGWL